MLEAYKFAFQMVCSGKHYTAGQTKVCSDSEDTD